MTMLGGCEARTRVAPEVDWELEWVTGAYDPNSSVAYRVGGGAIDMAR